MALDFGNKVENGGIPPNGVLPASEFNQLVAQVNKNEEDIAAIGELNSIESIEATESQASGGNNVITITETNGTETSFNVKNGNDGANGVSLGDVEIADNLTTNDNTKVLSAKQGFLMNQRLEELEEDVYVEEEPEWTQHKYYNTNDNHTIGDNCPPKSGGANSDYDCLDVDLTQGFTKIEFSCKGHWSSAQHYQACAYFFLDSLNKIVGIADTSDYTYLENIYTLSLKPSDIPEGAVKLCLNNKTRGSYSYATPSCVITKIRGGGGTPVPVDTTDIIYLNPGAKNILNNVSLVKADGFATVLTMAHITDTHGDDGNMTRFNEFCSYYGIDTKLHTGDVMYQAYNLNDFDGTLFTDTMIAIGNHDTAHYEGGWNWTGHQGTDCYNRFIAPFATGWGITSVDNRCYYYKDFTAKNIRLIVLDAMAHSTSQSSEQNTWFAARLADTLDSNNAAYGYDVIVAYHYIPSSIDLFDFPFTSEFGIEGVASHSDVVDIVTNFIANGGKFIAWLTGHTHRDYCGKIVRTVNGSTINQVVLSAATGGTDASNQDCARVVDEKSQDLFSIYGIDTTRKLIKIYRVGCDCDVWCRHKETACINYETAEVVIDEEAKDNAPEANSEKGVKSGGVYTALAGKQATLVSGTNIKTINNQSLLGSGNITIQGGGGSAVQSDWNQSDSTADDYIKNKPSLATVATSGSYDDLDDKPTIPDAQIQSDWNQTTTTAKDYIKNKPTIPAAQVQSNWSESDTSSKAYIQNKPTIPTVPTNVSAFNNDAGYLNNNFCPIIEDTRSSGVAAITGVAPFGTSGTMSNGQRIILHLKYNTVNDGTLNLTLSDNTTTGAKDIMYQRRNGTSLAKLSSTYGQYLAGQYIEMVYNGTAGYWVTCAPVETNTVYATLNQGDVNAGTSTTAVVINPKMLHDNAYIVEETYSSGSLKANKFYNFDTVSSALTIPDLSTTDLVSNALNFYALRFIAGADNLSITFPTGVIVDDEPTINTGDYVEIMINKYGTNYYASIKVWQAQSQNS